MIALPAAVLLGVNYIGPSSFSCGGLSRVVLFLWGSALGAENSRHWQPEPARWVPGPQETDSQVGE